jgi:hypothetical protein
VYCLLQYGLQATQFDIIGAGHQYKYTRGGLCDRNCAPAPPQDKGQKQPFYSSTPYIKLFHLLYHPPISGLNRPDTPAFRRHLLSHFQLERPIAMNQTIRRAAAVRSASASLGIRGERDFTTYYLLPTNQSISYLTYLVYVSQYVFGLVLSLLERGLGCRLYSSLIWC